MSNVCCPVFISLASATNAPCLACNGRPYLHETGSWCQMFTAWVKNVARFHVRWGFGRHDIVHCEPYNISSLEPAILDLSFPSDRMYADCRLLAIRRLQSPESHQ